MRDFVVVGCGAVGTALGVCLEEIGAAPWYYSRNGPVRLDHTLFIEGVPYRLVRPQPNAEILRNVLAAFIAVKAYDLEAACEQQAQKLPGGACIISLANGAVESMLKRLTVRHPDKRWRIGSVTMGVSGSPGTGFHLRSTKGTILWGPLIPGEAPLEWEMDLSKKNTRIGFRSDALKLARKKWLFNTVINTLAGAQGYSENGQLLGDLDSVRNVTREAYALGERLWGPWQDSEHEFFDATVQLIRDTSANENSMARDLRLGRKTENSFLAGLASDPGSYPELTRLSGIIQGLEQRGTALHG